MEGLKSETICQNDDAQKLLGSSVPPTPFREAVARALADTDARRVPTRWSGAHRGDLPRRLNDEARLPERGLLKDEQVVTTKAGAPALRAALARIGGEAGWVLRGLAVGGSRGYRPPPGRRGRAARSPPSRAGFGRLRIDF